MPLPNFLPSLSQKYYVLIRKLKLYKIHKNATFSFGLDINY